MAAAPMPVRRAVFDEARRIADPAEVADEAMTIAYRKWDDLREHPNPVGFVVITARRILSRTQRQRAARAPLAPLVSLEANPGIEVSAGTADPAETAASRMRWTRHCGH